MRILVTGAAGKVGGRLVEVLSPKYDITGIDVDSLDITDFNAVNTTIRDLKPDIVINPAAYTDVDGCARDPHKANLVNGYGAQNLAIATHNIGATIVQISSNEVFDGQASRPYLEYDQRNPINPYGYSKYLGERAVTETNPRHYIVRFSWLFAHGGRNFIHAILDAAKAGKNLRVVVDEIANPTYCNDLVDAIAQLIETGRYGTYHLPNEGHTSRYMFARYFLDKAGFADTALGKISHHEWQRPSTPPVYSGLQNTAGRSVGITLRPWQEAVDAFLEKEGLVAADA